MKVQEVLENYNLYKARISMAEAEINDIRNEITDIRSANLDGMPKAKGYVESNIEKQIVEREEKIEEKERYIRELKSKLKIVEDLVKILKKYNQDIIEMRYYSMMSIEEIATRKDKTYGAVKKALDRSIGKMQREYNRNKRVS